MRRFGRGRSVAIAPQHVRGMVPAWRPAELDEIAVQRFSRCRTRRGHWWPSRVKVQITRKHHEAIGRVTPKTILFLLAVGLGGWGLYRFAKTSQVEFMTLLGVFVAFLPALVVAGSLGYGAAPAIAVFGMMAGILIGGRHWWGEPRSPAATRHRPGERRRKKKRKPKPKPQKTAAAAFDTNGRPRSIG